ncbi:protein YgfX [Psychromonas hadalis]|uniref:protein YgfX n=1 Tax=Psychromonas hadalis TaxID=211669 RepID=UPI0003B79AA2|nr:protein YgfX [Psychromonas hadalis]
MLSSSALKYKISVKRSYCAGFVNFLLYLSVILMSLLVVSLNALSLFFYLILLAIAFVAARKAFLQQDELLLSESGALERVLASKVYSGKIGAHSFYNGFFIFLQLDIVGSPFAKKTSKQFLTIYKDAITEEQYRLIARLINSGRS